MLTRRSALFGLLAAPVIIKTSGLLMPISKPKFKQYRIVGRYTWNLESNTDNFTIDQQGIIRTLGPVEKSEIIISALDNITGKRSSNKVFITKPDSKYLFPKYTQFTPQAMLQHLFS